MGGAHHVARAHALTFARALALALAVAGCGGHAHAHATHAAAPPPRLTGRHPCPGAPGFTCAVLTVPLDHAGQAAGTLGLRVGIQSVPGAPRGVLVFLTGGPGQPGVPFIERIESRIGGAFGGYRLVMLDQRGTGAGALRCPALQAAAGSVDLVVPPRGAVAACAQAIGPSRRYFGTAETVADIEQLRRALGVPRLTLDGVSYGTFVAERYALTFPRHVARLVLDSVVPQQGVDPLYLAAIEATARVLRSACARERCGFDPARELAAIVRARHDGPALLNALVAESVGAPSFPDLPYAVHAAATGDQRSLRRLLAAIHADVEAPAELLSQGLHESTLCLDMLPPWDPAASTQQRAQLLVREAAAVPSAELYPFDRATAAGNGLGVSCAQWPATTPPAVADGNPATRLPPVPVLLLAGGRDLSTPLAWTRQEAAQAPDGHLLVAPDAGHSVQTRSGDPAVMRAVTRFLAR